jgi:hypothetical protein
MDKRTAISPEITAKKNKIGNNLAGKFITNLLRTGIKKIKRAYLQLRWGNHVDSRSLNWDWSETNFNRIAVVNLLLNKFKNPSYLEIGCASNNLFDSVPVEKKIGVDPSSGGNVRKTSDDFFKTNDINFDVIFIDGLHTYEQVRRDIINSIKSLNDNGGGWIALHDMLPRNWIEHHVPIVAKGAWTGDVWKVAFELIETKDIEFKIIKIDHGVGVIKVLNTKATLKNLKDDLLDKEFSYYYENLNKLPITDWEKAQSWLRS